MRGEKLKSLISVKSDGNVAKISRVSVKYDTQSSLSGQTNTKPNKRDPKSQLGRGSGEGSLMGSLDRRNSATHLTHFGTEFTIQ